MTSPISSLAESAASYPPSPSPNSDPGGVRRTLTNLLWVRTFANVEELRQALHEFKDRYNREWILERHDYMTPRKAAAAAALGVAQAA